MADKLALSNGQSMLKGITCKESQALLRANLPGMNDDCAIKQNSDSDDFEIEGKPSTNLSSGKAAASGFSLREMLTAKSTASKLAQKAVQQKGFRAVSAFVDEDIDILLGGKRDREEEDPDHHEKAALDLERTFRAQQMKVKSGKKQEYNEDDLADCMD